MTVELGKFNERAAGKRQPQATEIKNLADADAEITSVRGEELAEDGERAQSAFVAFIGVLPAVQEREREGFGRRRWTQIMHLAPAKAKGGICDFFVARRGNFALGVDDDDGRQGIADFMARQTDQTLRLAGAG